MIQFEGFEIIPENEVRECSKCHKLKPYKDFQCFKGQPSGWCRACKTASELARRQRGPHKPRPVAAPRSVRMAKSRAHTARWRRENREFYLERHRLHQFKRRYKIAATEDGTVTREFVAELYERLNCFYCDEPTIREHRTLDHKTPLSRNGIHSASNCEMACFGCNCSKGDKTEIEFRLYRQGLL